MPSPFPFEVRVVKIVILVEEGEIVGKLFHRGKVFYMDVGIWWCCKILVIRSLSLLFEI